MTESEIALTAGVNEARSVARELMDRHGLKGELAQVRQAGQSFNFRIVRPGTVYEVAYTPETGTAKVKTNVANAFDALISDNVTGRASARSGTTSTTTAFPVLSFGSG